jgi:hypothetical protein
VHEIKEVNHRITGTIRWQGFRNKNTRERHQLIRERVRNTLGMNGINVDILYPLAPGEKL